MYILSVIIIFIFFSNIIRIREPFTPKPAAPTTQKPATPATPKPTAPAATATQKPAATAAPATQKPAAPATQKPAATATQKPAAPATQKPVAPATQKPATSDTPTPETQKPAAPETQKPATPDTPKPATQFKPTPTLISNEKQTNNQIPIFVNPNNAPNEYATRNDVLENQNVSVQPKDMYYDIFNTNCVFSYNRPPECLIIKGNYVNKIPNKNCEKVCPDLYKNEFNKQSIKESFTNFIDDNRQKYFWCYEKCGCVKHKYDPTDPSKNTCGDNGISQYPLDVYLSEAQCNKKSKPCEGLDEDECRNTSGCGYCRNNVGQGQCFSSTTEGPLNVKLPCIPDRMKPTNSFSLGRANPFEGVSQFLPEAMINNIKK